MPSNVSITLEPTITLKKVRRFKETEKEETGLLQSLVSDHFNHMKFIITSFKKIFKLLCAEYYCMH